MIMLSFFNFYLSVYLYLIKLIGKTYIIYYIRLWAEKRKKRQMKENIIKDKND